MLDKIPLQLQPIVWWLRGRIALAQSDERGEIVPWVIIVAVTAALALAVGAIIVDKVTTKANHINLNGGGGSGS
jgi:hypothetical protein